MHRRPPTALYAATIFVGAFLLFQVQPILGKYIQPWFGSAASVWTTCMMFFQLALLAGYGYAHIVDGARPRRQAAFHAVMLAVGLGLMLFNLARWGSPLLPSAAWKPDFMRLPIGPIVRLLTVAVGLPFLLLAVNSSLMQAWYSRVSGDHDPYGLYAVSNAGSMLGLLSYPFLFEPFLGLRAQALLWGGGFVLYGLLAWACAWKLARGRTLADEPGASPQPSDRSPQPSAIFHLPSSIFSWVLLAFCGSILLLAVTTELCQDVSPIPLLWVLPLSLYLLSFVIGFSRLSDRLVRVYPWLLVLAVGLAALMLRNTGGWSILAQAAVLNGSLLLACLFCHGTLYALRPPARRLTLFYLMIAIGGAAGGVFVGVIAPLIFNGYWELHVGFLLLALMAPWVMRPKTEDGKRKNGWAWLIPLIVAFALWADVRYRMDSAIGASRNFYGALRIKQDAVGQGDRIIYRNMMLHGSIIHGLQVSRTRWRALPTAYFTHDSGIGRLLLNLPSRVEEGRPLRMGVLGLGIGTLAAYGVPGDTIRFYELNPDVITWASDTNYFGYLGESLADIELVEGDGLLSMKRELEENAPPLDVLVMDAFNGDAVPMHLLTEEAFQVYLGRLADDGVLAWNGTNKHLDFVPLAKAVAERFNLTLRVLPSGGDGKLTQPAIWILLARQPGTLATPALDERAVDLSRVMPVALWTDDHSYLLPLFQSGRPSWAR